MSPLDIGDALGGILREALHSDAERAPQLPLEWIGPTRPGVSEDGMDVRSVAQEFDDDQPLHEGRRFPGILFVAAAVVAVVVMAALVLAIGDDDASVEIPAERPLANVPATSAPLTVEATPMWDPPAAVQSALLDVGFIGLPAVGAQPSTPARGNRVLSISRCPWDPAFDGLTVYDDGRLIWAESGRYVEQRLTAEGVESMLSVVRGSGLLGTQDDVGGCTAGWYTVQTDDGSFVAPIDTHITRLVDPASWLPASAWEDREIKPFVPSEYGIFVTAPNGSGIITVDGPPIGLAAVLPAAARELLLANDWQCQIGDWTWCSTAFTTDETRDLVEAFDAAGYEAGVADIAGTANTDHLQYRRSETSLISIDFFARLPHSVGRGPLPGPG